MSSGSDFESDGKDKRIRWRAAQDLARADESDGKLAKDALGSIIEAEKAVSRLCRAYEQRSPDLPSAILSEIAASAPQVNHRKRWLAVSVVAACIVLLSVLGVQLQSPHEALIYVTRGAETDIVSLPDGSELTLNANTRVEVDYSADRRRLHLVYGEAYFDVEEDAARPFIVFTQNSAFKAIGTEFNIRSRSEKLRILVTEGSVRILPAVDGESLLLDTSVTDNEVLGVNQSALVTAEGSTIESMTPDQAGQLVSWRQGFIVFDQVLLAEIVEELNNYTDRKIVLMDKKVGNIRSGGVYRIGEEESFITAMQSTLPIEVIEVSPLIMLFYHKS